ncbi:MAG: hypothetical protein Q8L01_01140 [Candidatus Woesebacteria bacterium]|nr:hypothetical protein [Candidatus Woesebacteria bacterium]
MIKKRLQAIARWLDRRPYAIYAAIALAAGALFFWLQASGRFPDPDSFYHARLAALIFERGPVHNFPWLAKTVFADYYVDHHFLYHVLLIPFVKLAPSLAAGARYSSIFFGVAAILAATLLLRRLGAGLLSFLVPVFLLFSSPLIFRLNLAKTPALSLIILFLGFYAAARSRPLLLGFVAFAYVYLYDGWIILLPAVAALILADLLVPAEPGSATEERGWHWRHRLFGRRTGRLALATAAGIILGHVFNPYFPENLAFEWLHIVRIGLIGFKDTISVGAEWYPYNDLEIIAVTPTTFLIFLLGATGFLVAWLKSRESGRRLPRERTRDTLALFIFAAIALVFAIRSKRNIEYFVPFAVLAGVSGLDLFRLAGGIAILKTAKPLFGKIGLAAVAVYLAIVTSSVALRDWRGVRSDFENGVPGTKYAGAVKWLDKNTPEGALVFHSDWDDFPYFFLQSAHNRWLVGLDPTFMYVKDRALFKEWVDITQSKIKDRLAERVSNDFGAEYAFVDTDHAELKKSFESDSRFRLQYNDAEGTIFKITK